jgi:hypothetical protein
MSFNPFVFCQSSAAAPGLWVEIYRIARERTVEALRPTLYDRALHASAN